MGAGRYADVVCEQSGMMAGGHGDDPSGWLPERGECRSHTRAHYHRFTTEDGDAGIMVVLDDGSA
jgi:hypothetical protein